MMAATTVHVLHHGYPLCDFTRDVPSDWPLGHKWVSIEQSKRSDINVPLNTNACQACWNKVAERG